MDEHGEWVVVVAGPQKYIGFMQRESKDDILEGIALGGLVMLKPAFEFHTPLQMNQQGQLMQSGIIKPLEHMLDDTPHYVRVDSITFFSDMSKEDRTTYNGFIENARKGSAEARAKRSGLVLANGPLGNPGGRR